MGIEDRIAKALLRKHASYMTASGWFTEKTLDTEDQKPIDYKSAKLLLGDTEIVCKIADDSELQVKGLNGHKELGPYEGMIFPQALPRRVSFHMDQVQFPIDIVFIADDSRVSKIVENVEPGQPGQWGMPHVVAVIELNGGFCAAHGIEVGAEVRQSQEKIAQVLPPDIQVVQDMMEEQEGPPKVEEVPGDRLQDELYDKSENVAPEHHMEPEPDAYYDFILEEYGSLIIEKLEAALASMARPIEEGDSAPIDFDDIPHLNNILYEAETYFGLHAYIDGTGVLSVDLVVSEGRDADVIQNADGEQFNPNAAMQIIVEIIALELARGAADPVNSTPPPGSEIEGKIAQEKYPTYTRKDINPIQLQPNVTKERFKNKDLVDKQVDSPAFSPLNEESNDGFDLNIDIHDENNEIGPNVRPL